MKNRKILITFLFLCMSCSDMIDLAVDDHQNEHDLKYEKYKKEEQEKMIKYCDEVSKFTLRPHKYFSDPTGWSTHGKCVDQNGVVFGKMCK